MPIKIQPRSPHHPPVTRLLEQSHALMLRMFGAQDCHFMGIDALCAPTITLFAAEEANETLGCVALRRDAGYGEVKSMFVDPAARGRGVGHALLTHLVDVARTEGLGALRLETGVGLDAAHALYHSQGFNETEAFGEYQNLPVSRFFFKAL